MSKYLWILLLAGVWGEGYAQEGDELIGDGDTGTAQAETGSAGTAVIYGEIESVEPVDTMKLVLWRRYLGNAGGFPSVERLPSRTEKGNLFNRTIASRTFSFHLDLDRPGYFSLYQDAYTFCDRMKIRPGDSVFIHIDTKRALVRFTGPNAIRFQAQYDLARAIDAEKKSRDPVMTGMDRETFLSEEKTQKVYQKAREAAKESMLPLMRMIFNDQQKYQYLEEWVDRDPYNHRGWEVIAMYRPLVDESGIRSMEFRLLGEILQPMAQFLYLGLNGNKESKRIWDTYTDRMEAIPLPDDISYIEPGIIDFLYRSIQAYQKVNGKNVSFEEMIHRYGTPLGDYAIAYYVIRQYKHQENPDSLFSRALEFIQTSWLRTGVQQMASRIKTGTPFPDISLKNADGKEVRLSEFQGKAVLIDFWYTGCGACLKYYRETLGPVEERMREEDEVVFASISSDRNREVWLRSIQEGKYTSPDLLNLATGGFDHPLLKYYGIRAYPTQMLLDREGKIYQIGNFPKDPRELEALIREVLKK
ncbi:TlpA family protein disulfide reductase [Membranihabitans maritimus]|uniref:TlpA family protein disulfide reductase n=1 Tax=Membranihabitans maritimus TaxID=2904244 RepID=UPI001F1CDE88|nr:TlpA disulfide reductase family protein [Membranihabitans maritimus]